MKTVQVQIQEWEAKRAAKAARLEEIMNKAAEESRTLAADESEEHDTITEEVVKIDEHLKRLDGMQKQMVRKAIPVGDPVNIEDGSRARTPGVLITEPKLEKGIGFARLAKALYLSQKTMRPVADIAREIWPTYEPLFATEKNVAAGTTTGTNWALPLINYQILATEFAAYLRPQTILGKFGTGNIPSLRHVPFIVKLPRQITRGSGYWVGEGLPKPLTEWQLDSVTLGIAKVATIAVITEELLRFSNPSAEALVRDELAAAVIERIDIDFINPAKAAVGTVSPASITNGAFNIVSAGQTAVNISTDAELIAAPIIQANMPLQQAVWIMNANTALSLSLMMTVQGTLQYPTISINGGTFVGMPVIVSQYVPTGIVIFAIASEIMLADDGNVSIDVSREASLEMLASGSSQTAVTGVGAQLVSMFQTNSVAFRAEREINWVKRRPGAVAYITNVRWGGTVGSGDI